MTANDHQVGGSHYKTTSGLQHWDIVLMFDLDYFSGQITKYLFRWRKKGGIEDLKKARHFLDKLIESEEKPVKPNPPDWLQHVKPTGWIGFTFEGADAEFTYYTCSNCKAKIQCDSEFDPPWNHHDALSCSKAQTPERQPWELRQLAEILAARSSRENCLVDPPSVELPPLPPDRPGS